MKKRMFFLISNKHEYFEFRYLYERIKYLNIQIFLLIENNHRNSNIDYDVNHKEVKIIPLEPINYSKNIFKSLYQKSKIKKSINSLKIKSSDFFIYFNNSSFLFFLLHRFFTKKNCITIMLLTTGYIIPNNYSKLNIFKTIELNLLSFFLVYKILKYINFENSSFKNINSNILHDYIFILNNKTELKPKFRKFQIASYFSKQNKEALQGNKSLIILSSYWIDIYKNYNYIVKAIIKKLGMDNVTIKDHPSSSYTKLDLQKLYGVNLENILDKNIDLEKYIASNLNSIKSVYGPTSAALKYSSFMGISTYCFSSIFMNESDCRYTNDYFKNSNVTILNDIEKSKIKNTPTILGNDNVEDIIIQILN